MQVEMKNVLRRDFLAFARKAILELSGTKLGKDPYLEYLATELLEFVDGKRKRLLINLPPRHLKTSLCSVCLAAWKLAHEPKAKIMVVTYAEQLAETKDRSAVRDFATTEGGTLYAVSIGGGITGRGADLIIVDDPHEIQDAGRPQSNSSRPSSCQG